MREFTKLSCVATCIKRIRINFLYISQGYIFFLWLHTFCQLPFPKKDERRKWEWIGKTSFKEFFSDSFDFHLLWDTHIFFFGLDHRAYILYVCREILKHNFFLFGLISSFFYPNVSESDTSTAQPARPGPGYTNPNKNSYNSTASSLVSPLFLPSTFHCCLLHRV